MNKSELLEKLSEKFYKVETPTLKQTPVGNLKQYLVKVYDLIGDALRSMELGFYVKDEGETSEVAFWLSSEPKPTSVAGFTEEINDYIKDIIGTGKIEGAFIEIIDEVNEIAVASIVMNDLTKQRRFVDRDADGNLRHRPLA